MFALLLAAVPLRHGFPTSVEKAARQWNDIIGNLPALVPAAFRAELADHVAGGRRARIPFRRLRPRKRRGEGHPVVGGVGVLSRAAHP
ncbi:hypothetical protein [Streptomyces sp. NPDC056061]|uniref:hypothetical protein n=1 Tax=Streptomyces sp. NPDC056061 TaxID=3345700 RepID=UPI0035DAB689